MLSLAVFLPIVCGLAMFACRGMTHRARQVLTEGVTLVTSLLVLFCLMNKRGVTYTPLYLLPKLPISFCIDGVGSVFAAIVAFLWPLATLYGFEYMEHEGGENHFFALYTMTYGVTLGIATAANVLTLYLFYEFLTLCTLPLVLPPTVFGFYLLLAGDYSSKDIVSLVIEMYEFIRDFKGEVPGASPKDCGNYLDMNLSMANYLGKKYLDEVLYGIDESRLVYPE